MEELRNDELQHYGVLGMKWGVRRAVKKMRKRAKLEKKAEKYDIASSKYRTRAEWVHAKRDIGRRNIRVYKSAVTDSRIRRLNKKIANTDDDMKRLKLEKKAATLEYKNSLVKSRSENISKTVPYGKRASKLLSKSHKYMMKAAKARQKLASNEFYIEKMRQKVKSLPPEEIKAGQDYVNELLGKSTKNTKNKK